MLQERKGFFYEPELLDYKPVYARPDMNIMLKIIEAGAEKVAHQQDMLNKVEDSVRKTPAYLDQDVDYVGNITKQIDTEISSMMDGTVDLLDPANTGKVMQIAKKYMYDPELAKITSRTGKISKSQEQIEAMRKAGKISAANYWEFSQSILGANEAFAKSKKYNPDVNLHYDIVPYGDVAAEGMKVVAATKTYKESYRTTGPDHYINIETIEAANPQIALKLRNASITGDMDAYNKAKEENDTILTNQFINTLSGEAVGQLKAEAKMLGEDEFGYITKRMKGYVEMVNGYSHTIDKSELDANYKLQEEFRQRVAIQKMADLAAKTRQDAELAARAREGELNRNAVKNKEEKDAEAAEVRTTQGSNVTYVASTPASKFGIPKAEFSISAVKKKINTLEKQIGNSYNTTVVDLNKALAKGEYPGIKGKAMVYVDQTTGKLAITYHGEHNTEAAASDKERLKLMVDQQNANITATKAQIAEMKKFKTDVESTAGYDETEITKLDAEVYRALTERRKSIIASLQSWINTTGADTPVKKDLKLKLQKAAGSKDNFEEAWKEVQETYAHLPKTTINSPFARVGEAVMSELSGNNPSPEAEQYFVEKIRAKVYVNSPARNQAENNAKEVFLPTSSETPTYSLHGSTMANGQTDAQIQSTMFEEFKINRGKVVNIATGKAATVAEADLILAEYTKASTKTTFQMIYNPETGNMDGFVTTANGKRWSFPISQTLPIKYHATDLARHQLNVQVIARLESDGSANIPGTSGTLTKEIYTAESAVPQSSLTVLGITIPLTGNGVSTVEAAEALHKIEQVFIPSMIESKYTMQEMKSQVAATLVDEFKCTKETADILAAKLINKYNVK